MSAVIGEIKRETSPEAKAHWRQRRRDGAASAFQPKSLLTLSQWADQFRYLSADLGEPGIWRTDRVPYLREPMDAITDPRVRRVSVMKSARIGATQGLVVNTIGYCVHQDPTSIVVGLPIDADAQKFSSSLLQPAIDDTPVLHERIQAQKSKKKKSTLLTKTYAGGQLHIVGTKSPRALRMVHGRYILKSEIDAWEGSAGDDGDPYNLIDKRAGAYTAPKYIEESTPLTDATSRIAPAFRNGTMEYYHVPCAHCEEYQRLVWGGPEMKYGLKWDRLPDGSPDLNHVFYVCVNGCVIDESDKYAMVARGRWVATHPERTEHRSFHLNALVSPFDGARWPVLVDEFYKAKGKPEKLRVFVNTILGETFTEEGEQADADLLTQRRDNSTWWDDEKPVPAWAAVLTRSCDTQGDRIETCVWAWGHAEECALIDFEVIPYDPATQKAWDVLDEVRLKRYRHASGRELLPRVTFIDAGGHHSKQVNTYCRARQRQNVFAIFGATKERAPILGSPTRNNAAKTIQYPIGVFAAKEALLARLEKIPEPGPGYIHLPEWLEDEQIHQLTAEKLVQMGDKRVFKKTRARNEMTDLWVYAFAALHQLGPKVMHQLGAIAKAMMERGTQPPTARPAGGVLSAGID